MCSGVHPFMGVFREAPGGAEEGVDVVSCPDFFIGRYQIAISNDVLHPTMGGIQNLRDLSTGKTLIEKTKNFLLVFKRKR